MTTTEFDPEHRLVMVPVWISGPAGTFQFRLALDTGASQTQISRDALTLAGYDLSATTTRYRLNTVSGSAAAGALTVDRFDALGDTRFRFSVIAHTIPSRRPLHGLLGLDFVRDNYLALDFGRGRIRFGVRRWWQIWL